MNDPSTVQKFRDAQYLFQEERWAEALRLFDDLSLSYKSDKEIMLNRAMCLARIGKEEEAELLCDHITIVHKDPRGALLKAQIPRSKREGKTAPEEKKKRKPLVSREFLKVGVLVCFLVALGLAGWSFYSSYEAPVPPPISTAPAPDARTLRFPEDASVGTLFTRDWGYATNTQGSHTQGWQRLAEAKGKIEVPAGKEVRLVVSQAQAGNLSALRRLGPDAIQGISLNDCPVGDTEMGYLGHLTGLFELSMDDTVVGPEGYAQLLRLKSLREISIIDTTLGEAGRQFIAQQPYLAQIDADRADLGDEWLIGLPALEKLTFLSLDDTTRVTDEGIQHIARHRNIQSLFLSYTGLTDEGMKHVQTLQSLRRAWFEGTKITDASMPGFRLMPNIQEIGIALTEVTNDGLMELSDIRTLKKVGIKGCPNITAEGVRRFKARNPECFVETDLNVEG